MSETPRTDEAVKQLLQVSRPERVSAEFARKLEREWYDVATRYDEMAEQQADLEKWARESEYQSGILKNKIAPLEAENAELRRTHQGGQTGIECAELAAQNHALRVQLSESATERANCFREIENLREEISRLRWQQRAS
jgi:transcription initiation factor IIF auxiliary subunit